MLGQRKLIVILGLSRGGTNHLAQRVHSCAGVAGFSEGMSRMIVPSRHDARQIIRREALESAVLKPQKPAFDTGTWSFNKVNYTLVSYPEGWAQFLNRDSQSRTLLLLRHPLMIHRSRVQYVQSKKPQRRRWLDAGQLAREFCELLALAWRIPAADIVFHEQSLDDNYHALLSSRLALEPTEARPEACPACRGPIEGRARASDRGRHWLFCAACDQFIEGEGDYNFLRREEDVERCRFDERQSLQQYADVQGALCEAMGRPIVEFFANGEHWSSQAAGAFRALIDADADRWRHVPLNEILYPY